MNIRKLFRTKMLPFLLILSLVTNGISPELVRPSTVYAAEAPSRTTAAAESEAAQTETADVVLKNGGIEIDGQSYTDAEFKTLLENSKIVRIPFDSETGRSMIEQAVVSGLVIDTAALAVLGVAIAGVFIMLAVRLALSSLKDNAYQVITGNGKIYDFRFLDDRLFINNTYINAFTSTIAVITSFFNNHFTANPNEEVVVPDAGSGETTKPGEGTGEGTDAIATALGDIASQYDLFECKEAAEVMADYLRKQKQEFKFITMAYPKYASGIIISLTREAILGINSKESQISTNGHHYGMPTTPPEFGSKHTANWDNISQQAIFKHTLEVLGKLISWEMGRLKEQSHHHKFKD